LDGGCFQPFAETVFRFVNPEVSKAVDLRNGSLRQTLSLSIATIRNTDRHAENQKGKTSITQAWGEA